MEIVLTALLLGIGAGFVLRDWNKVLDVSIRCRSTLIFLLLFVLGLSTGSNPAVAEHMADLGLTALVLGLTGTAGSVVFSFLLNKICIWR